MELTSLCNAMHRHERVRGSGTGLLGGRELLRDALAQLRQGGQ
jgi:hypothetical protein